MIVFTNEDTISVSLDTGDPRRPAVFQFRPLTFGEMRRAAKLKEQIDAASGIDAKIGAIESVLIVPLVGWTVTDRDGNAVPFEPGGLLDWLPQPRVAELLQKMIEAQSIGRADRGK